MKYFIRAVKYFIYLFVIMSLILAIVMLLNHMQGNINGQVFRGGWTSVMWIAAIFAAVSAFYPTWGYRKDLISLKDMGEEKTAEHIRTYMDKMGYAPEQDTALQSSFVLKKTISRLTHSFEDRITFEFIEDVQSEKGPTKVFSIEGPTRDIVRITGGLSAYFSNL